MLIFLFIFFLSSRVPNPLPHISHPEKTNVCGLNITLTAVWLICIFAQRQGRLNASVGAMEIVEKENQQVIRKLDFTTLSALHGL